MVLPLQAKPETRQLLQVPGSRGATREGNDGNGSCFFREVNKPTATCGECVRVSSGGEVP